MDDLNSFALRMLNFVEQSVTEALDDPVSRPGLLSEADCAVRILEKTLRREDEAKLAQFNMIGAFVSFEHVATEHPANATEKLKEALQDILNARMLFDDGLK